MIDTLHLFPVLNRHLVDLLAGLETADWQRPTVLPGRTVHDLAAHLLDGTLRRLADCRDGHASPPSRPITGHESLVAHIQEMNATWMRVARRLSPQILVDLLGEYEGQLVEYFAGLDADAPAPYPVSWAGQSESANWFDIAREYTEKWHHQAQIRLAVGAGSLETEEFLGPVLDTFALAQPHTYESVPAEPGTSVTIAIDGSVRRTWQIERQAEIWASRLVDSAADAEIAIDAHIAWRLLTNSIDRHEARNSATAAGPESLIAPFFDMVTVMAPSVGPPAP